MPFLGVLPLGRGYSPDREISAFQEGVFSVDKFLERKELNELEKQGLTKAFEYTYALAWNTIKDFEAQGETSIHGSRDALRLAYQRGLIENGEIWMEMIESRVLTARTYNESTAERVIRRITTVYFEDFRKLRVTLEELAKRT